MDETTIHTVRLNLEEESKKCPLFYLQKFFFQNYGGRR